jgi:hypothetical protein
VGPSLLPLLGPHVSSFLPHLSLSLSPPDVVLLLSLLLLGISRPLRYGGGNPEILNWWEPFTVSIIDVDVVVVGAKQDEGDAEPEFANVDSPGGDSVVELSGVLG